MNENQPVSSGREEIDAAVDSTVRYSPLAVHMQLLSQVFLILLIDILHYGLPAGGEESVRDWNILVNQSEDSVSDCWDLLLLLLLLCSGVASDNETAVLSTNTSHLPEGIYLKWD